MGGRRGMVGQSKHHESVWKQTQGQYVHFVTIVKSAPGQLPTDCSAWKNEWMLCCFSVCVCYVASVVSDFLLPYGL